MSSAGPQTLRQPQRLTSSSLEAHGASPLHKATFAVLDRPASSQATHERNPGPSGRLSQPTGVNSKPRRVLEDGVNEGSTEYHAKSVAPHSCSEGQVASSEHERIMQLELQLSITLSLQTERDQRIAQLTDELALKSALLEQVEANAKEGKGRARLELREHEDRLVAQTSLVKRRDAELVDMQSKLRNMETELDELLPELINVRAELEAKKSELDAVRLRLEDAEDGWARSKAELSAKRDSGAFRTVTAASLVDLNEDRAMYELKEDMHAMKGESASLQWNEKEI